LTAGWNPRQLATFKKRKQRRNAYDYERRPAQILQPVYLL
jgi:hypothetical protein